MTMVRVRPPIVVGVDFSDNGRLALDAAVKLAQDMGTTLVIVHAFPHYRMPMLMMGDLEKQVLDEARAEIHMDEALTLSEEWVAGVRDLGLEVEVVAEEADPDDLVLETADARKAGLIVVGTHGRTGLKHVLMGSIAESILRRSTRPVLVVPRKKK